MNIKKYLILMFLFMPVITLAQTFDFDRDLYFGLQNDSEVIKLQEFLTEQEVYSGPITGNFFSLTLKAVKKFQIRENITPVGGYFGPKTKARANKILSEDIKASQEQATVETGSAPTPMQSTNQNDIATSLLEQIRLLQKQINELKQKTNIASATPSGTMSATPAVPATSATPAVPSKTTEIPMAPATPAMPAVPATTAQPATSTPPSSPPTPPTPPPPAPVPTQIVKDDFNNYVNGNVLGQGNWTNYVNGGNFVIQSTTTFEGLKALYNNSYGDAVVGKSGTLIANGKQSLYIRTENRSKWGFYSNDGNVGVRISKGLNASGAVGLPFVNIGFTSDGRVTYYDKISDTYKNFATYNDNEWTFLEVEWRSIDGTARYRVNKGNWIDWHIVANGFSGFDYVNLSFILPSGSGGVYFDTLR